MNGETEQPDAEQVDANVPRLPGDLDLTSIEEARRYSYQRMDDERTRRTNHIRESIGARQFPTGGTADDRPLNVMNLTHSIYGRQLVANNPRALVTGQPGSEPSADTLGLALNRTIERVLLKIVMRQVVEDSFFGLACVKWGRKPVRDRNGREVVRNVGGRQFLATRPYVSRLSFDNLVIDMMADSEDDMQFVGNRYRLPLREVMTSARFGNKEGLQQSPRRGDSGAGSEKATSLSRGADSNPKELEPGIDLWDIWIKDYGIIVTYPENEPTRLLKMRRPKGPARGPYRLFKLRDIPDQILPLAISSIELPMHKLINNLLVKLGHQAEDQKNVGLYRPSAAKDAKAIFEAKDGTWIKTDNPEGAKVASFGGPDRTIMAFVLQAQNWFSWMMGNLDSMGGLAADAQTLGQERLLTQASGSLILEFQSRVYDLARDVMKTLAWLICTDPLVRIPVIKTVKGAPSVQIQDWFTADTIAGELDAYGIEVSPYSMQSDSPSDRLAALTGVLNQFILPLAPMLQQQGGAIDVQKLFELVAKWTDLVPVEQIIKFQATPEQIAGQAVQQAQQEQPPMAAQTTRTNVRVNKPGGTRQGRNAAMMQTLLGAGVQDGDMASLATTG